MRSETAGRRPAALHNFAETGYTQCRAVFMTNKEIMRIAMEQSAEDIHCTAQDFLRAENVVVRSCIGPEARRYYREPVALNFVSYGNNVVASVRDEYRALAEEYISRFSFYRCFETPSLNWLAERLSPAGQKICFMAEYELPDAERLRPLPCGYEVRILENRDFEHLYVPEWQNALCAERKELDVLGAGAYADGTLVALAGASADCRTMWQIGVDVLPEFRRNGIAASLVSTLASEILRRGIVPFYCSAWSNLRSVRTALKSGFVPAWVELTVKPAEIADRLNIKRSR